MISSKSTALIFAWAATCALAYCWGATDRSHVSAKPPVPDSPEVSEFTVDSPDGPDPKDRNVVKYRVYMTMDTIRGITFGAPDSRPAGAVVRVELKSTRTDQRDTYFGVKD